MLNWYSRESFVLGERYVDADGRYVVEYSRTVPAASARVLGGTVAELIDGTDDAEPVLVFKIISPEGGAALYTHTRSDADRGYGFVGLVEADAGS